MVLHGYNIKCENELEITFSITVSFRVRGRDMSVPFLVCGDGMEIIYKNINEIRPYGKNPRKNDAAVEAVARSIDEFGFKVPCVIDREGTLVTGHTRFKAAKKRGLKQIPCIVADDLSEEQIRAFRLADNKVSEKAKWDMDLLGEELQDILKIDMTKFDFKIPDPFDVPEIPYYGAERERTFDRYNLSEFDPDRAAGFYQMPELEPCNMVPDDLISFNYVLTSKEYDKGVHFYVDDYQFERIWDRPKFYIEKLRPFKCCLTPDFSLYTDMPMSMKVWNVYRSRLIGQMMQNEGLPVIPTVSWAEARTFGFAFAGLPKQSVLSVSTIGVKRDKEAMKIWTAGMDALMEMCEPRQLLVYGGKVDYDYGDCEPIYFTNRTTERMGKGSKV